MKQSERWSWQFTADLPRRKQTELDYIPCFSNRQFKTVKERFGISAYESVMNLLRSWMIGITQISVQLIKHLNAAVGEGSWLKGRNRQRSGTSWRRATSCRSTSRTQTDSSRRVSSRLRGFCGRSDTVTQTPTSSSGLDDQGGAEKWDGQNPHGFIPQEDQTKTTKLRTKLVDILKTASFLGERKVSDGVDINLFMGIWDFPRDPLTKRKPSNPRGEWDWSIETAIRELKDLDGEALSFRNLNGSKPTGGRKNASYRESPKTLTPFLKFNFFLNHEQLQHPSKPYKKHLTSEEVLESDSRTSIKTCGAMPDFLIRTTRLLFLFVYGHRPVVLHFNLLAHAN